MSGSVTSQLADQGQGRCVLSGALTLPNLPWLWKELETTGLLADAREVDLSSVQEADSAGLALLMAWKAFCLKQGGDLAFRAVPKKLLALAKLTGAESALVAG